MIRVWKSIGLVRDFLGYCVGYYYGIQYFMILGVFCMGCVYICKALPILVLYFLRSTYADFVFPFKAVALKPKTSRP